jgi:hypothetical protein
MTTEPPDAAHPHPKHRKPFQNVSSLLKRFPLLGLGIAAAALVLIAPATSRADDSGSGGGDNKEGADLSDDVGDGLAKLEPLLKANDYAGAIGLVNGLLAKAGAESYDQAFLYYTLSQIYTQKGEYASAIAPLETTIAIADKKHYFPVKQELEMLYILSQLYDQQAETLKGDKDAQDASYTKAITYIERWVAMSPRLTEDISTYYAQLLYASAVSRDPAHPDQEKIKQAQDQIQKTLLTTVHPKDSLYTFLLATLQQQNNYERGSEILELLLSHNPNNKNYWADLAMFYMAQAQDPKNSKDDAKVRHFNIRAINTIERAQRFGFMNTQRDNYSLFTLYYNMDEYSLAAELLHKGLSSGNIESNLANWTLLAASYQQISQDFKAVAALEEAAKQFPTSGELEYRVSQVYQGLDDTQKAYDHVVLSMQKGNLAHPQQTYIFAAYVCFELQKLDDAKDAIDKALALMKNPDHQAIGLRDAIDEAIKERDAKAAANKA